VCLSAWEATVAIVIGQDLGGLGHNWLSVLNVNTKIKPYNNKCKWTSVARLSRRWQNASVTEEWLKRAARPGRKVWQLHSGSQSGALHTALCQLYSLSVCPGIASPMCTPYIMRRHQLISVSFAPFFIALCLFSPLLSGVCTVFSPISAQFYQLLQADIMAW